MNKINIVFIYCDYSGNTALSFLDWIYRQCNSKDIEIIDKFWFDHSHCRFSHRLNCCNLIFWKLHLKNRNDKKFLYL